MKVVTLSWEYPPRTIGGLARHVAGLSQALVKNDVDVHVLTVADKQTEITYQENGVTIHKVSPYPLPTDSFVTDIQHLNFSMLEKAIKLINELGRVDIIHAHDWLVAYAARALKHTYKLPLVATIHATEYGRNGGLHNDLQRYISSVEWWLAYEAWKVIVCSEAMQKELQNIFQIPRDKMQIINNGIDLAEITVPEAKERNKYALPDEKIVFFVGRLVPEKGVQTLIEAIPKVLEYEPKAKFMIAGKGPYEEHLKYLVRSKGLEHKVNFLGFIDDLERNSLYSFADCVVFPSNYEPFGIVALEGMATGTPIVVSDVGGLGEIVEHGVNGLKCITGNPDSLAQQIIYVFSDPAAMLQIVKQAKSDVLYKYSWNGVAKKTLDLYKEVINESKKSTWLPLWLNNAGINETLDYVQIGRYEI